MTAFFRTALRPTARRLLAGLGALAACNPSIAAAQSATVLLYEVADNNTNSTANFAEAQQIVPVLPRDALVFVNASGGATYAGPLTGAGIRVSIRYGNSNIVTEDDMFEGQSINMTYRASVSHVCLLPQGATATFTAWTERLGPLNPAGTNANTETKARLEVVAIAASFPGPARRTCGGAF
jgi:hypothetical protein